MAAYRRVYGFGHLRADCRGPESAPEAYAGFEYGIIFTFTFTFTFTSELFGIGCWPLQCVVPD